MSEPSYSSPLLAGKWREAFGTEYQDDASELYFAVMEPYFAFRDGLIGAEECARLAVEALLALDDT